LPAGGVSETKRISPLLVIGLRVYLDARGHVFGGGLRNWWGRSIKRRYNLPVILLDYFKPRLSNRKGKGFSYLALIATCIGPLIFLESVFGNKFGMPDLLADPRRSAMVVIVIMWFSLLGAILSVITVIFTRSIAAWISISIAAMWWTCLFVAMRK